MNTAAKGRRLEHRTRRLLEAAGYRVIRSAGSLGPFDLVGLSAAGVVAVQVKANRAPSPLERRTMADYPLPPGSRRLIHVWRDRVLTPEVLTLTE
jgi:Holliday junction resolvase